MRVVRLHLPNTPPPDAGIYVPCDLTMLIEAVIVPPGSSTWYREDIGTMLRQSGIDAPVLASRLDAIPDV